MKFLIVFAVFVAVCSVECSTISLINGQVPTISIINGQVPTISNLGPWLSPVQLVTPIPVTAEQIPVGSAAGPITATIDATGSRNSLPVVVQNSGVLDNSGIIGGQAAGINANTF